MSERSWRCGPRRKENYSEPVPCKPIQEKKIDLDLWQN